MVYEDGNWNIKNKAELDTLYKEKEMMLEEWIEEERYPELKEKFMRYLNNKENDETLNMIKDEIKMMMYNKKKYLKLTA
jgi:5'-deoxynucleotidase YfbR-like HD superfamily hydrolase